MAKRSYEQFCPLAVTLDLLGERWTMLVIRELIAGPKRYTDLRAGLEAIPTDILTRRLRDLEAADVVSRRRLPPPAASNVYELTDRGRTLEPALLDLARFGIGLLGEVPGPEEPPTPERFGLLLRALFDPDRSGRRTRTVALQTGERGLWVRFGAGDFEVGDLLADPPEAIDATVAGAADEVFDVLVGRSTAPDAVAEARLELSGDGAALEAMLSAFPARDLVAA